MRPRNPVVRAEAVGLHLIREGSVSVEGRQLWLDVGVFRVVVGVSVGAGGVGLDPVQERSGSRADGWRGVLAELAAERDEGGGGRVDEGVFLDGVPKVVERLLVREGDRVRDEAQPVGVAAFE